MDVLAPREAAEATQPGMTWEERGTDARECGFGGVWSQTPVHQFLGKGVKNRDSSLGEADKLRLVQQGVDAVGSASKAPTKGGETKPG
jgi:hypothetical protein